MPRGRRRTPLEILTDELHDGLDRLVALAREQARADVQAELAGALGGLLSGKPKRRTATKPAATKKSKPKKPRKSGAAKGWQNMKPADRMERVNKMLAGRGMPPKFSDEQIAAERAKEASGDAAPAGGKKSQQKAAPAAEKPATKKAGDTQRRYSEEERAEMLRKIVQLKASGLSIAKACTEVGISTFSYHRWKKDAETKRKAAAT